MTDIPTSAGDLAAEALVKLIEVAIEPIIDRKIRQLDEIYSITFQTHLEIIQNQGRRLDLQRGLLNEQSDRIDEAVAQLDDLIMRHRLANTKLAGLDGARAGHQNHIAELFDLVGQLQQAMTEAEAAIADLENPAPCEWVPPPPQPADNEPAKPFGGIFASLGKLTPEQLRKLMPEQPSLFGPPVFGYDGSLTIKDPANMATSYTYTGGDWLKTYEGPRITLRTYGAGAIKFDASGVAQPAVSGAPPKTCADNGLKCCDCPSCEKQCRYCGRVK